MATMRYPCPFLSFIQRVNGNVDSSRLFEKRPCLMRSFSFSKKKKKRFGFQDVPVALRAVSQRVATQRESKKKATYG